MTKRQRARGRQRGVSIPSEGESAAGPVRARLGRHAAWTGPLLLAVAYFLGAEAAFYIGTLSDQIFALFWPPNVILFCTLLIVPQRCWWRFIAAAFPAHAVAEHLVGMPLPQLLVAFATNCMVALINAYAVRRFVGEKPWFGTFDKASRYVLIAVGIGPALSAFGGAFVPILGGGAMADYARYWAHWYLANALPNLTLGPVFLIWLSAEARGIPRKPVRWQVEPAILAVTLMVSSVLAATLAGRLSTLAFLPAVLLLPLPILLWAAARFGEKGASAANLVVAVVLTWWTLKAEGLVPREDPATNVLSLQLFLTGLAIPVLLLGALIDEVRRGEQVTRKLAGSLLKAQDEERRRIARGLHESTGQNLAAANLLTASIAKAMPDSARGDVIELADVIQQSMREVGDLAYLLHPPLLDDGGLAAALSAYADGFARRSGILVSVDIETELPRLPLTTELALFRVAQEALANIWHHSESPRARLRLTRANSRELMLTVEDYGIGIAHGTARAKTPGHARGSGIGLASMRERLDQIGGRLKIDSVPGRTTIGAVVPIESGAATSPWESGRNGAT